MAVSMDDFRDSGGAVDWERYRAAQVGAGEACRECGAIIVFSKGKPSLCVSCNLMHQDRGEITHERRLRCPHCAHLFGVDGSDDYNLYTEGRHTVDCPECEGEFEVQTAVTYHFTSPELDAGLPKV